MSNLISFAVTNEQPFLNALINLAVAVAGVLMFAHLLLVVLENFWPGLKKEDGWVQAAIAWLDKWTHGSGAWDIPPSSKRINWQSATAPDPDKTPKGFVRIETVQLLLALTCLGLCLASCAGVAWNQPVFYAGPTVAPIEEITLKNPQPAAAAGFQATVGLGQFEFASKEWDSLDLSALALGGVVVPASGPAGMLQAGVEVGTLNGIIGLGILFTPYTADNQGFLQGGGPGLAFAGMLNVQAIVAYFGGTAETQGPKLIPRLPRGGL